VNEHGSEPVRGLPGQLPEGERLLWQGSPTAWGIARRALHVPTLALYFAVLLAWGAVATLRQGAPASDALSGAALPAALAFGTLGLLAGVSWLMARTTVYTVTSRRVVARFGIAVPVTVNFPFALVDAVGLRAYPDATGDIPLSLSTPSHLPWPVLWPHVRPWRLAQPNPMLRAVPDAARVASLLGRALAAAASQPASMAPASADSAIAPARGPVAA
jgi:hypothetical protein